MIEHIQLQYDLFETNLNQGRDQGLYSLKR